MIGFVPTNADPCILAFRKNEAIIVEVYVDDLLLGSKSYDALDWLKD